MTASVSSAILVGNELPNVYQRFLLPFLIRFDAETIHENTLFLLRVAQSIPLGRLLLRTLAGSLPSSPVQVFGLVFPNVLGVAAGFDKDAVVAPGLAMLGFGHVEVGTLTPRPQTGNPRPRLFRLPSDRGLINRMGFPNCGAATAADRLLGLSVRSFILGVSLGKQRETPLSEAIGDYTAVMRAVYPCADYLAVNLSSPNTPSLRELQFDKHLRSFVPELVAENRRLAARHGIPERPLLLKIDPDLSWSELDYILANAQDNRISGPIATNSTLSREGLTHPNQQQAGGLSGRPLTRRSNEVITYIRRHAGSHLPVIE